LGAGVKASDQLALYISTERTSGGMIKQNHEDSNSFGKFVQERLKQIRRSKKWLASSLTIKPTQVSMLTNGNWIPTTEWAMERVPRLAALLECDPGELERIIKSALSPCARKSSKHARRAFSTTINKAILKAIADAANPTHELLKKLQSIERILGTPLSHRSCLLLKPGH
jgi:hypothetical protein